MNDFYTGYTFMKQIEMRRSPELREEIEKPVGGVMQIFDWDYINERVKIVEERENNVR